jgi:predicted ATPase
VPGGGPVDVTWSTPELLLWHNGPDAIPAAEAKVRRALEIARGQSALSWELRCATGLARLWQRQARVAEPLDLLAGTYQKFTERFSTGDLIRARSLIAELESLHTRE